MPLLIVGLAILITVVEPRIMAGIVIGAIAVVVIVSLLEVTGLHITWQEVPRLVPVITFK